jgi:integrase
MTDMPIELPYTTEELSRHGKLKRFVRFRGKRIQLMLKPGDPAFLDEYRAALQTLRGKVCIKATPVAVATYASGTLGWLVQRYLAESPGIKTMAKTGVIRRTRVLKDLVASHGSRSMMMPTEAISAGLAKRAGQPGAANEWLKTIKALYSWSCSVGITARNPAAAIRKIKVRTDGFHIWSIEEIFAFAKKHPKGTAGYLALMLFIFTGLRRSDGTLLGLQHVKDGVIRFRTGKTGSELVTAYAAPFREAVEVAHRRQVLAFLVNGHGKAFASGAAFGNWFKDRCDEAGLPHCTAHGLRKAGASIAADEGASDIMLDAMFGWSDESGQNQSRTYTRAAQKLKLATEGFALIERALARSGVIGEHKRSVTVAPQQGVALGATNSGGKVLK